MRELIKYSFLAKIRDLSLVFWPLVFPLVLTTAMYFSIGQMEESDFETIHAAIVTQSAGEEDVFQEYLETMGDDKENRRWKMYQNYIRRGWKQPSVRCRITDQ